MFADSWVVSSIVVFDWLVGCLFGFYGVSTIVGYLMPTSIYMYIHSTKDLWTNI